jgi:hypothetical protein
LTDEVRDSIPYVPWSQVIRLRDILSHHYTASRTTSYGAGQKSKCRVWPRRSRRGGRNGAHRDARTLGGAVGWLTSVDLHSELVLSAFSRTLEAFIDAVDQVSGTFGLWGSGSNGRRTGGDPARALDPGSPRCPPARSADSSCAMGQSTT